MCLQFIIIEKSIYQTVGAFFTACFHRIICAKEYKIRRGENRSVAALYIQTCCTNITSAELR